MYYGKRELFVRLTITDVYPISSTACLCLQRSTEAHISIPAQQTQWCPTDTQLIFTQSNKAE